MKALMLIILLVTLVMLSACSIDYTASEIVEKSNNKLPYTKLFENGSITIYDIRSIELKNGLAYIDLTCSVDGYIYDNCKCDRFYLVGLPFYSDGKLFLSNVQFLDLDCSNIPGEAALANKFLEPKFSKIRLMGFGFFEKLLIDNIIVEKGCLTVILIL